MPNNCSPLIEYFLFILNRQVSLRALWSNGSRWRSLRTSRRRIVIIKGGYYVSRYSICLTAICVVCLFLISTVFSHSGFLSSIPLVRMTRSRISPCSVRRITFKVAFSRWKVRVVLIWHFKFVFCTRSVTASGINSTNRDWVLSAWNCVRVPIPVSIVRWHAASVMVIVRGYKAGRIISLYTQ